MDEQEQEQEQEDNRYRQWLEEEEGKSQQQYDKAVLQLNAGALGVSFAFIRDILDPWPWCHTALLLLAWLSWALSLCLALVTFYLSVHAMRKQIKILDNHSRNRNPFDRPIDVCNWVAGGLFVTGIVLLSVFVFMNI